MRQYVLCLTEAMPHDWLVGKRVWSSGTGGKVRDCNLGDRTSLKARASKSAGVFRCWMRTRLWRRHRPRSEQAGILHYGKEGGILAFA
jgi:hypothetical protein